MNKTRYILDDVHPDYIKILQNLFKKQEFIVKNFREDKNLSFLREDDCLVLSLSTILANENLFTNLRQNFICYTANALPHQIYLNIGNKQNCKGFICSSIENQSLLSSLNIKSFFAPNIYPDLKNLINSDFESSEVSSFINYYKLFASKNLYNDINSYEVFESIKKIYDKVELYDSTTEKKDKDIDVLIKTKYCLHIKYWGHVCNAPLKSLALGVPVIMDSITYNMGCYSYYLQHQFNCLVLQNPEDILKVLKDKVYDNLYINLKRNCINFRQKLTSNYSEEFYENFKTFLN